MKSEFLVIINVSHFIFSLCPLFHKQSINYWVQERGICFDAGLICKCPYFPNRCLNKTRPNRYLYQEKDHEIIT
jgi:hypothetical protein